MPNALVMAGAGAEPTNFAPLNTNRIFTGLWTNRSLLRDAATSDYQEHYGMGRQDSILGGFNSEISSRLTLIRRYGSSVYNSTPMPPITRWYSFNTFTTTSELIRVMADANLAVYDVTAPDTPTSIFTKTAGAGSTYFLGVGNILYFTNGTDNKQWNYATKTVSNWGFPGPTAAPTVSQVITPNPGYQIWHPSWVYSIQVGQDNAIVILDPSGLNLQMFVPKLGSTTYPDGSTSQGGEPPVWNTGAGATTIDGEVTWNWAGQSAWKATTNYGRLGFVVGASGGKPYLFAAQVAQQTTGVSGTTEPGWLAALGALVPDAGVVWQNLGPILTWPSIGPGTWLTHANLITDNKGYFQTIVQLGKTGSGNPNPPNFGTSLGALTIDNNAIWKNTGIFSTAGTAAVQYGYAYENSATLDISNMSPPSIPITVLQGNEVVIQGIGSGDSQVDTIPIYRTTQGGSTFLLLDTIPNPGAGQIWTYKDNIPDSGLNTEIQAQVGGEGTPLPAGATCLGYHLGRIFAAVGNVVWISSGPDAVASGSSGNAGFDTFFTCQSKITRFWVTPLGMVVLTVRDAYLILGSATSTDPLYMVVFIESLPLRSYDCFTVNKTTAYMLMGNNQLISLDPSAGIIDVGYPIADLLETTYDSADSYVTFHSQSSRDSALYVGNGNGSWYRMANNSAPEQGTNWSTQALIPGIAAIQSVEVLPGQYRLLMGCRTGTAPILARDGSKNTDNGTPFPVETDFGNIMLALPGELAALTFITLESVRVGTRAGLALLLGEISGKFESLSRTRQDPTNLPPSNTLFSDRYHFAQNQKTAWCRHFQMRISWPAEDAPNELLAFTVFGQTWQEFRSQ
jgi:hypothetical protein